MGICKATECHNKEYAMGLCNKHFRQKVKYGNPHCMHAGCEKEIASRGYCFEHCTSQKKKLIDKETPEYKILQIVGFNIKEQRNASGLKQNELAMAVGLSRASLGSYERGESSISIYYLIAIAKYLEIDVVNLLSGATRIDLF